MVHARQHDCDRIRGWVSAELDGELSELETALLQSHLRDCGACRAFSAEASTFTAALRAAPAELPTAPVRVLRRRRALLQPLRVPAVAALALSAVALSGLFASLHSSLGGANATSAAQFANQDLRAIRLEKGRQALAELRRRQVHYQEKAVQAARRPGFVNP
jgi:predicted anti-sigma-YlaC factor YlaD